MLKNFLIILKLKTVMRTMVKSNNQTKYIMYYDFVNL